MTTDEPAPVVQQEPTPKTPIWRRAWFVPAVALLVGIGIGAASSGGGDPVAAPAPTATKTITVREPAVTIPPRTVDPSDEIQAGLDAEAAELDQRSAALDAREAAIAGQEAAIEAGTIPGDGVYLVGTDVQPGTYRTAGGSGCYWARLDINSEILDNYLGDGQAVVTIQAGDALFETNDCGAWTIVP